MSISHKQLSAVCALTLSFALGSTSLRAAPVLPSSGYDLLLATHGGVADINGSTVDGGANYSGLPAANLNDGERDGVYNNGLGVDGSGSLAHSSGANAGTDPMMNPIPNEMGVTIPVAKLIESVDLFNRTDCCNDRIDGNGNIPFTLNVFNGATNVFSMDYKFSQSISESAVNPHNGHTETDSGMVITLPAGTVGTYVQIIQHNNTYMNLAELEAYTPEPASLTLFGLGALGLLARRR